MSCQRKGRAPQNYQRHTHTDNFRKFSYTTGCFGGSTSTGVYLTLAVLTIATVFCTGNPVGERVESYDCDSCQPHNTCRGSDVLTRPEFFDASCCGRCGAGALEDWCASLAEEQIHLWVNRSFCPWRTKHYEILGDMVFIIPLCSECQPQVDCSWSDQAPNATEKVLEAEYRCCIPCGEVWLWAWCEGQCSVGGYSELEERMCSKFMCPY